MLKNGRPYYLPQLNISYEDILEKLDEENIGYDVMKINPNENDEINASQDIVYANIIGNVDLDDNNPIWLAGEDEINICDGHHRYFKALFDKKPIMAVKLKCSFKDACRILNKIQDIHEYQQSQGLEEVEVQDTINYYGDDENQFLNSLEEDNTIVQAENSTKNQKTIVAYRQAPIKENSVVGNFFTLNPIENFDKYEIDFENLLDTNGLGITYKDSQSPVDILSKIWFPNINFEKISKEHNISPDNLKCKAIAEKAKKLGFDGIKYGDTIIQGIK